ncbi:hypothetical protein OBK29_13080 [Empedobacter falsenii]|uniref:HNH endonuclease n=1 Tax=Empedobacter falsenii TaxID=343874 RepID=UPI003A80B512
MIPIDKNDVFAEIHYLSIKEHLLDTIDRVLKDNGIYKGINENRNLIKLSKKLKNKLEEYKQDPDLHLKSLIQLQPDKLNDFIKDLWDHKPLFQKDKDPDNLILQNIFIKHGYEKLDKYVFIKRLNINACPYCNRSYVYVAKKNKKVKPEIDHFYPKHIYPILGSSYYNLIPSCEACNGTSAKGKIDSYKEGLVNPYLLKSDDFVISHKINNISIIFPLSNNSSVDILFEKAIDKHLAVFNLKDLYELHQDHGVELVIKHKIKYSSKYRKYLNKYRGLRFSDSEVDRLILGNYSLESEQNKRPLSKLYQDLGKELDLI